MSQLRYFLLIRGQLTAVLPIARWRVCWLMGARHLSDKYSMVIGAKWLKNVCPSLGIMNPKSGQCALMKTNAQLISLIFFLLSFSAYSSATPKSEIDEFYKIKKLSVEKFFYPTKENSPLAYNAAIAFLETVYSWVSLADASQDNPFYSQAIKDLGLTKKGCFYRIQLQQLLRLLAPLSDNDKKLALVFIEREVFPNIPWMAMRSTSLQGTESYRLRQARGFMSSQVTDVASELWDDLNRFFRDMNPRHNDKFLSLVSSCEEHFDFKSFYPKLFDFDGFSELQAMASQTKQDDASYIKKMQEFIESGLRMSIPPHHAGAIALSPLLGLSPVEMNPRDSLKKAFWQSLPSMAFADSNSLTKQSCERIMPHLIWARMAGLSLSSDELLRLGLDPPKILQEWIAMRSAMFVAERLGLSAKTRPLEPCQMVQRFAELLSQSLGGFPNFSGVIQLSSFYTTSELQVREVYRAQSGELYKVKLPSKTTQAGGIPKPTVKLGIQK